MKLLLHILLLALMITQSTAQDDPNQILQNAADAITTTPGFTAKVTLSGEGSQMILSTLPSLTARLTFGPHSEQGPSLHMLGELRPTQSAAPESFDIVYTTDKYIWTDHPKSVVNIRPPSVSARQRPTVFSYLLLAELAKDQPFNTLLSKAESIELEDNQSIAGTDCRVVFVTRAKPGAGTRRSGAGAHTHERWFIGVGDNLPRRVEHITDAGMIKATLIMELTNLSVAPQSDDDLSVFAPETYTTSDTTKKPAPKIPDADQPYTKPDPKPVTPPTPTDPAAPNYAFTDTSNNQITRASQQGRITVLYFFGSWSIPANQTSPLLATLADDYTAQTDPDPAVDIFAIALRESDPDSVQDDHAANAYTLAINPPNTLASLFQLRVYPTIIVIDDNSRIVFSEHLTKDRDAQQLIDETKAAITKARNP